MTDVSCGSPDGAAPECQSCNVLANGTIDCGTPDFNQPHVCQCTGCAPGCSFNYQADKDTAEQNGQDVGDCTVVCGPDSARGWQGGEAGPGGPGGIIRIAAVTAIDACDQISDFSESNLGDPAKVQALDERCSNGIADDGSDTLVDCDAPACKSDPNVTVCNIGQGVGLEPPTYAGYKQAIDFSKYLYQHASSDQASALALFDPIVQPAGPLDASTSQELLPIGGGAYLVLRAPSMDQPGVVQVDAMLQPPGWAPQESLTLPAYVFTSDIGILPGPELLPGPSSSDTEQPGHERNDSGHFRIGRTFFSHQLRLWHIWAHEVRSALVDANPQLPQRCRKHACQQLRPIAVDTIAWVAAQPDFRRIASAELADTGSPPIITLTSGSPSGSSSDSGYSGVDVVLTSGLDGAVFKPGLSPGVKHLCQDPLEVLYTTGAGRNGQPGPGGKAAADKRCPTWYPTYKAICVKQANPGGCTEVSDACQSLLSDCKLTTEYPDASGHCPSGFLRQPLPPRLTSGDTVLDEELCPYTVTGPGGVDCTLPDGPEGTAYDPYPVPTLPPSTLHTWPRALWNIALRKLHPLETMRRRGVANTRFKRGDLVAAIARYRSTQGILASNEFVNTPYCSPGANCSFTCPDNLGDLEKLPDDLQRVCNIDSEITDKLGNLAAGQNYYGYPPNYVPPTSARTFDPLVPYDLIGLATNDVDDAQTNLKFWLTYAAVLKGNERLEAGQAINLIDAQRTPLQDAINPGGELSSAYDDANTHLADDISIILELRQQVAALQTEKVKLQDASGKTFDAYLGDLAEVALIAAAEYYGGPAAALAVTTLWETGQKNGVTGWPQAGKGMHLPINQSASDSSYDFGKNSKDWYDATFKSDQAKKDLEGMFLTFLHEAQSSGDTKILDVGIDQLTTEIFKASVQLTQDMVARREAQQKVRAAIHRIARIDQDQYALTSVKNGTTNFPPEEVQYQLANAAFQAAAQDVEHAGETFFLLRRGVERDLVPLDPATGTSTLTADETKYINSDANCTGAGVTAASLDIDFTTLQCFRDRINGFLKLQENQVTNWKYSHFDVDVPFSDWTDTTTPGKNPVPAYRVDLLINLALAQQGLQYGQLRQKLHDVWFFLQSDNPTAETVALLVNRPSTSSDRYLIGYDGTGAPLFENFDLAVGANKAPSDPLYELLRDTSSYNREAFACNALTPNSTLTGNYASCELSGIEASGHAFVDGRSLMGPLQLFVRKADLAAAGITSPVKLTTHVVYSYPL